MKHIDAASHARGESQYVDDVPKPAGLLYAAVSFSPVAHGRILKIHTDAARAVHGVTAVFTANDIPGRNKFGPIIADDLLFAKEEVRYIGEPLALVVAKTPEIARKGVSKITLEATELPVITDPREAFVKGEIIGTPKTFVLGDVDDSWKHCDLVVEGVCESGGQEHMYLETQRTRAIPLECKTMRVYSSTQSPSSIQKTIAEVLGVPYHSIEVEVKRLGGGFGGKEDQATPWACMAALAAWHLNKPVELVLSRSDDMKITGKRHPYSSDFKIGVTSEGKILAYDVKFYQNAGATSDLSPAVLDRTLFHATNAYFIPNVRAFGVSCRTNLPSNTAMRGFGGPQGMFVIESALARAAEKLGMSREEIQYKNLLREGDIFPYGQKSQHVSAQLTWQEAEKTYNLPEIRNRIKRYNENNFETKKGHAMMPICFGISFTNTFFNQASSLVHVYTDGSVSISTAGVEMGQGISTKIAGIAVKALGIHEHRVKIESVNTTRISNMSPTAASSSTDLNGNATLLAIEQILDRMKGVAAKELNLSDKDKITVSEEKILYNGKETGWNWHRLVETAYFARVALSAHAFYATPGIGFDKARSKGNPFSYHVFGTACIEVTIDCLRGTYDIDSIKVVHDLGRSVNHLIDRGQVEGGLAQGLGWMTMEDLRYDEKGRLLSNSMSAYKVPDVFFMPDDLQIKFLENVHGFTGPYGSKAVGEPPLMYGIGVFFAIRHAMRAFRPGKDFAFSSPITPEKVLTALHSEYLKKNLF